MSSPPFARMVFEADPGRFRSALWAPADKRAGLLALYALDAELSRQMARAAEPALVQIRLTWWSEAIAGRDQAVRRGVPLLETLGRMNESCEGLKDRLVALCDACAPGEAEDADDGALPGLTALSCRAGALGKAAALWLGATDQRVQDGAGSALAALSLATAALRGDPACRGGRSGPGAGTGDKCPKGPLAGAPGLESPLPCRNARPGTGGRP